MPSNIMEMYSIIREKKQFCIVFFSNNVYNCYNYRNNINYKTDEK